MRLDLLGRLPGFDFVVTPDVLAEIVLPDQKQQLENAVAAGILRVEGLSDPDALGLFSELRRMIGVGEAAVTFARHQQRLGTLSARRLAEQLIAKGHFQFRAPLN